MLPESPCWVAHTVRRDGYAMGYDPATRRMGYAHRLAYEWLRGAIPPGMTLDHLCRVRACYNPWHLEVCTSGENSRRGHTARGIDIYAHGRRAMYNRGRRCQPCRDACSASMRATRKKSAES